MATLPEIVFAAARKNLGLRGLLQDSAINFTHNFKKILVAYFGVFKRGVDILGAA